VPAAGRGHGDIDRARGMLRRHCRDRRGIQHKDAGRRRPADRQRRRPGLLGVGDRHRRGAVVVPEVGLSLNLVAFTTLAMAPTVAAVAPVGLAAVIVTVGAGVT
jgi:hypothetical protein